MPTLKELRELHSTYNKHEYNQYDVCIGCLEGIEKLNDKEKIQEVLRGFNKQEVAESFIPLSWWVINVLDASKEVNWDKIEKILVPDFQEYKFVIDTFKMLKGKVYIQEVRVGEIDREIVAKYILSFSPFMSLNLNITKYIKGDISNTYIKNCINITKPFLKDFLEKPNLFCHAFVPEKYLDIVLQTNLKYIAFMYPRAFPLYLKKISRIPDEVIQLSKEIDKRIGFQKEIPYEMINTNPRKILEEELRVGSYHFRVRSGNIEGRFLVNLENILITRGRYYAELYRAENVEIVGYFHNNKKEAQCI